MLNQDITTAISEIKELLNTYPNCIYLMTLLSKCYYNIDNIYDSYSLLKQIHIKEPLNIDAMDLYALILKSYNNKPTNYELEKYKYYYYYYLVYHIII